MSKAKDHDFTADSPLIFSVLSHCNLIDIPARISVYMTRRDGWVGSSPVHLCRRRAAERSTLLREAYPCHTIGLLV